MTKINQKNEKADIPKSSSTVSTKPKGRGRPPGSSKKQRGGQTGNTSRQKYLTERAKGLLNQIAIGNGPSEEVGEVVPIVVDEASENENGSERRMTEVVDQTLAQRWEKKVIEDPDNVRRVEEGRRFDMRAPKNPKLMKTPRFVNNRPILKRSQSADSLRNESEEQEAKPGAMRKAFSVVDFQEIQEYAEAKLDKVADQFEFKILNFELKERNATMKKLRSVLSTNQVFTEIPCDDSFWTFDILADIFSWKGTPLHDFDIYNRMEKLRGKMISKSGLLNVGQTSQCKSKKAMNRREAISTVMMEHKKFDEMVQEALKDSWNATKVEMDSLQKSFGDPLYSILFQSYKAIFSYNRYLIQHLFQFLASHLFNPLDVYHAIDSNGFWKLRMRIKQVTDKIPQVVKAFFNMEPLSRQLEDLEKVGPKLTKKEVKDQVTNLARIAMERVRLPASAKQRNTAYLWPNKRDFFLDTFDLLHLEPATPNSNAGFKKFMSEAENRRYNTKDVQAHCTQFHHTRSSKMVTLFKGFFNQSDIFYKKFRELMPDSRLDRKMKIYIERKGLTSLWETVKTGNLKLDKISDVDASMIVSTIISKPKTNLAQYEKLCRDKLNNLYLQTLESPYCIPSVSPSYIGVIIVTLDDQVFVSILKEHNPMIDEEPEELDENGEEPISQTAVVKKYPHLKHKDFLYLCTEDDPSAEVLLSLDPKTGDYWISLTQEGEPRKSERAYMGYVDLKRIYKENWETLEQQAIIPVRNRLKNLLNERFKDGNAISEETTNLVNQLQPHMANL